MRLEVCVYAANGEPRNSSDIPFPATPVGITHDVLRACKGDKRSDNNID